jgi:hypothetical protein
MNEKIQSQVLKEVDFSWTASSDIKGLKEDFKKAISRTIELMEEQEGHCHIKPNCKLCFAMWRNGKEDAEAEFRKMIEEVIENHKIDLTTSRRREILHIQRKLLAKLGDSQRQKICPSIPSRDTSKECGKEFITRDLLTRKNRDGSNKYSKPRKAICGKYGENNAFIDLCKSCKKKTSLCQTIINKKTGEICGHELHYHRSAVKVLDNCMKCKCKKFQEVGG